MNILLVEDDEALAMGTEYSLRQEGFTVTVCVNAKEAKEQIAKREKEISPSFDCILLDVMLPDDSGYALCEWFRENMKEAVIIFLTALSDEGNVIRGLDLGADDYVTKPFRVKELAARIRSNVRRVKQIAGNALSGKEHTMQAGNLRLDEDRFALYRDDEEIALTPSEYKLLRTFMENRNRILTRTQLIERLWDVDEAFVDDNTLSVYVRRLREKMGENENEAYIKTVRGMGYQFVTDENM